MSKGELHICNHAETSECVTVRETDVHAAVLSEENSRDKQDFNKKADEENMKVREKEQTQKTV